MTTGLAERLRWDPDRLDDPLAKEAADEIERLECHLTISQGKHENAIAEIERLELAREMLVDECRLKNIEIERLRAVIEDCDGLSCRQYKALEIGDE